MYDKRMWNDKRYHSLDYYLKQTYGEKVYKVYQDTIDSLNAQITSAQATVSGEQKTESV